MKTLIVEDDFTCRFLLEEYLRPFGPLKISVNGKDALFEVKKALENGNKFDLICIDIMMPEMDGQLALEKIREIEMSYGIYSTDGSKILMTTALDDFENIKKSFGNLCDGYLIKPIEREILMKELEKNGLPH